MREVAENILKSLTPERQTQPAFSQEGESEEEEEMSGYDDDFSVGIDLPMAVDTTSGNVTPIPTTGELEELRLVPFTSVLAGFFFISLISVLSTPGRSRLKPEPRRSQCGRPTLGLLHSNLS